MSGSDPIDPRQGERLAEPADRIRADSIDGLAESFVETVRILILDAMLQLPESKHQRAMLKARTNAKKLFGEIETVSRNTAVRTLLRAGSVNSGHDPRDTHVISASNVHDSSSVGDGARSDAGVAHTSEPTGEEPPTDLEQEAQA